MKFNFLSLKEETMLRIIHFFRIHFYRILYKLGFKIQKSRKLIHDYWENPNDGSNLPISYETVVERSNFLLKIIIDLGIHEHSSILEIGCNTGRNLNVLYENGFTNLNAIEISKNAIDNFLKVFPITYDSTNIIHGPVEEKIEQISNSSMQLVITMAVLEHIHDDVSENLFCNISRITGRYLITIEDEIGISNRHFPRVYKDIFEKNNMVQVYQQVLGDNHYSGLSNNFVCRVFEKLD